MKYILTLFLALPVLAAQAQNLTSEEAVRIALKNSMGIQLAKNNTDIAAINTATASPEACLSSRAAPASRSSLPASNRNTPTRPITRAATMPFRIICPLR